MAAPRRPTGRSAVPPGSGDLEVRYTALSFVNSQAVRFKYKLEGFDKDWVDVGPRRAAYYTNLPPATYSFQGARRQQRRRLERQRGVGRLQPRSRTTTRPRGSSGSFFSPVQEPR